MSTRAGTAAPLPRPRQRPRGPASTRRRRPARSRASGRTFPRGLALLGLVAVLLGGIVWINVAKLDLATETGRVIDQSRAVQVETVTLRGQLERRDGQVQTRAEEQLGMFPVPGEDVTYLSQTASGYAAD